MMNKTDGWRCPKCGTIHPTNQVHCTYCPGQLRVGAMLPRVVTKGLAAAVMVLCLAAVASAQTWQPPMGIPMPPFGITDQPMRVLPSVPASLGTACSQAQPCLVEGGSYGWVSFTGGSWIILQHAKLYGCDVAAGANHIVVRDSEIVGDLGGGGCTVGNGQAGAAHYVLFLRDVFHDIGDVNATTDQDAHCGGVGYESDHVWWIDNVFYRCGGDGIQVNGGQGLPNWRNLNHIYIGRNTAIHNRQSGFCIKNSVDVVLSENVVSTMHANSGGPGAGLCELYGSDRFVTIGNRVSGVPYGLYIASDSPGFGVGQLHYDNVIFGTFHDPNNGVPSLDNANSDNSAAMLSGGVTRVLLHNTFVNAGGGIDIPAGGGAFVGRNNLLARISRVSFDLEGTTTVSLTGSLYDVAPTIVAGGVTGVLTPAQAQATASVIAQPVFKDEANADFTLVSGPGKGQALALDPNDWYRLISGGSLVNGVVTGGLNYRDVHGVDLPPQGADIGAFGSPLLPHPLQEPGAGVTPPPVVTPPPPVVTPPPVIPPPPVVTPPPATPPPPTKPKCPHTLPGFAKLLRGQCTW